jgi:hypothetical protein
MLALILAFYSLADAQEIVDIPCGTDIDQKVNSYSNSSGKTSAQLFRLRSCTYTVSQEMRLFDGDAIEGVPGVEPAPTRAVHGTDPEGLTSKLVASNGVSVIMRPQGHFVMRWVDCSGARFTGSAGSGVCIAAHSMADTSEVHTSYIHHNERVGVSNARGTFFNVEAAFNGESGSQGLTAGGIKGVNFYEVAGGYYHDNFGNALWCDSGCDANSEHPVGFYVHDVEASNNGGGGIRYENSATSALIEKNHVYGNAKTFNRGGVSVRDAQDAVITNNIFDGPGYAHNQAPDNIAIYANGSGKSGRVKLANVLITQNTLNSERIKTCGGVVSCTNNH